MKNDLERRHVHWRDFTRCVDGAQQCSTPTDLLVAQAMLLGATFERSYDGFIHPTIDGYQPGGWDNMRRAALVVHLLLDVPYTVQDVT